MAMWVDRIGPYSPCPKLSPERRSCLVVTIPVSIAQTSMQIALPRARNGGGVVCNVEQECAVCPLPVPS